MATEIRAPLHFRTLLTAHTYLVADFYATWCPPCKTIAPVYAQLSTTHAAPGKIAFVKVNVDEQREIAAQYGITAMPTFLVFKEGKKVEEVKGADVRALKSAVEAASKGAREAEVKSEKVEAPQKEKVVLQEEGKTVSGSYGMTGGNSWKMSLH
jgi:thioredoxin 1